MAAAAHSTAAGAVAPPQTPDAGRTAFLAAFRETLAHETAAGRDYGGLLTALGHHLDESEELDGRLDALAAPPQSGTLSRVWGRVTCTRSGAGGLRIEIAGPAAGDRFELTAASAAEAAGVVEYVGSIDIVWQRMREVQDEYRQILQKQHDIETMTSGLKQQPGTTVNEHILLLQQYNDMKDVGQQLIGLIADNRGVPIGSLYENEDYGVGHDD